MSRTGKSTETESRFVVTRGEVVEENGEIIPNGHGTSFWDDENVLKLDNGDGSTGEGNGNPFQYSCLENSMDRGAWWATVHGVAKNWT